MVERHLSVAEVRTALGISRTTLWRLTREGRLPRPVRITQKRVAWPESEIAAYLASRKRSGGEA